MHGLIHTEFASYLKQQQGIKTWQKVIEKAGLADRLYLQVGSYPDEEIQALVAAAAELTEQSADELLEGFGFYLVPRLIESYRSYIDPQWKTLELLLNTEQTIHRVVRLKDKFAAPPRLKFSRSGESSLLLEYDSPRKMQAVARGMIKGVADFYGEQIRITESSIPSGGIQLQVVLKKTS